MKQLRQYIRTILESRFKQMSKPRFTGIKTALMNSTFLDADPEGDLDDEVWSSEAAKVLSKTMKQYFDANFGNNQVNVIVHVDYNPTDPKSGPDSVLKSGTYYFDGSHNVELILANIEDGTKLKEMGDVSQKIYEVIMHELLHMQQFLKFSQGNPTVEKWDEFMREYESLGGASKMGGEYFFFDKKGPSELETFSLQIAVELIDRLGQEIAVKTLQRQNINYDIVRENSPSFRLIEKESKGMIARPELREMMKRAKEYAKRLKK